MPLLSLGMFAAPVDLLLRTGADAVPPAEPASGVLMLPAAGVLVVSEPPRLPLGGSIGACCVDGDVDFCVLGVDAEESGVVFCAYARPIAPIAETEATAATARCLRFMGYSCERKLKAGMTGHFTVPCAVGPFCSSAHSGRPPHKVGGRVCLLLNIAYAFCAHCERALLEYRLTVNPGSAGGGYGFAGMGPYSGGLAECQRVSYGDLNCLLLLRDAEEKPIDYAMLSDIFPTGYHATELAGAQMGGSVVVYGAGPVGLTAACSASIGGASQVMVVDVHRDRLQFAEKLGAIAIDNTDGGNVESNTTRSSLCGSCRTKSPLRRHLPPMRSSISTNPAGRRSC